MEKEKRIILHAATHEERTPVCGYARVTTVKNEQAESYHYQEAYWTRKLSAEPKYNLVGVFGDEGISGATQRKRPGFNEMLKLCRMGKIKIIFTKSVARFGRNTTETLETVQELRELGVAVVFEIEGIDTSKLTDELMLRIKAILAEQELKNMSKQVAWGARRRFAEGSVEVAYLYGYDIIRNEGEPIQFIVNEKEAENVRLIYKLYLDGNGFQAIVNYLEDHNIPTKRGGEWSKNTIEGILRNEKYIGDALLQKSFAENGVEKVNRGELPQYYIENNHEPIIDRATFAIVQAERAKRANKVAKDITPVYTEFTSKIECGRCGKAFQRRTNTKIKNFGKEGWSCVTANNRGVAACSSHMINEGLLKEITMDAFNEYLATPHKTLKSKEIEKQVGKLVEEENTVRQLFQDGKISYYTFNKNQKELKAKYKVLDERIAQEQGFELYKKEGRVATEYQPIIVETHIEKVVMNGYKIKFIFKNKQEIIKEFCYAHRRYCKAY